MILLLMLLCIVVPCQAADYIIDASPYTQQAKQWIQTYIYDDKGTLVVPHDDLQSMANILYFSYYRSKITLDAQDANIKALHSLWHGYENICATRRNPSKNNPHTIDVQEQRTQIAQCINYTSLHHTIGKTYAHIADAGVNGTLLQAARSVKALGAIRQQARIIMTEALINVRNLLGSLYYTAATKTGDFIEHFESTRTSKHVLTEMLDFVQSHIPQLAIKSFVDADNFNNHISSEGWNTLMAIQHVSYKTWLIIEQARASLYKAHYQELYNVMQQQNLASSYYAIIVDEHGLQNNDEEKMMLPTPDKLP